MPHGNPRTKKVLLTLTDKEKKTLERLARKEGLPVATYLRLLLRREEQKQQPKEGRDPWGANL